MSYPGDDVRAALLDFVDQYVPGATESVWLTGSRARGDHQPDSDWDAALKLRILRPRHSFVKYEGGF